ncbi:hypothetical protein LJC19_03165 [Oxalobacter sp. OttesenSCG-928-P03]|nr:hypothetical protein [Oxalobacter sp. OttesenSCG-928-P03]
MSKNIVAFVGENENEILKVSTQMVFDVSQPKGFQGHVINLRDPAWAQKLQPIIDDGIFFAYGAAGIGAGLTNTEGKNIWDAIHVPFLSILGDHPSQIPRNHQVHARHVVNCYVYREHFDVQRQIIRSPQLSMLFPLGVARNPCRDNVPWKDRTHKIVFLKSGGNPEQKRAGWSHWPGKLRTVLEEASAEVLRRSTGDIAPVMQSCLDTYGINLDGRHDVLLAMLSEVDWYTRLARLTKMARALCRIDAEIIGARWEHIDKTGIRAKFRPGINASKIQELFANSKFVVNVTPNFASGIHERVPHGFAARACVVSDDNDCSRSNLSGLPTYFGFDWADPDWEEKLISHLEDSKVYAEEEFQPALDLVNQDFSLDQVFQAMLEIAEVVRMLDVNDATFQAYGRPVEQ